MIMPRHIITTAFIAFFLLACDQVKTPPADQSTTEAVKEQRLLIIGSYIADMVVALGAADKVVGIGAGADHIAELADVPVIPGFRNTSAEPMLALSPTIALFSGRQTRPELIEQLKQTGVEVHLFKDDAGSIDLVPKHIRMLGEMFGKTEEAEEVVKSFHSSMEQALDLVAQAKTKPRGLFILSGGGRPTVVAGGNTDIALLLELAGAKNMTSDITNFKPMSQEKMIEAAPEFILINKEGAEVIGDLPVALKAPGILLTPAGKQRNIITLPTGYLVGLGLHTPKAIEALARRIHPDLPPEK